LKGLRDLGEEDFELLDLNFTTFTVDGREVELIQNGESVKLSIENRENFVNLTQEFKLVEFNKQLDAMLQGILDTIPRYNILTTFTWQELESLVIGSTIIDPQKLKSITRYQNCSENSDIVKHFWTVFEEFNQDQRSKFIKFVSGRSSISLSANDLTIQLVKYQIPDIMLPSSHTCFFTLDLPNYSSIDVLRNKLLYAINNCVSIDTDFRV